MKRESAKTDTDHEGAAAGASPIALPDLIDNSIREPASHFRWFVESARPWLTALTRVCLSYGDRDVANRARVRAALSELDVAGNEYAAPLVHRHALQGLLTSVATAPTQEDTPRLAAAVVVTYLDRPVHALLRQRVPDSERFSKSSRRFRDQVLKAKGLRASSRKILGDLAAYPDRGDKIGFEPPELAMIRDSVSEAVGIRGMCLAHIESIAGLEPDWTAPICGDPRLRIAARLLRSTLLHPQTLEYGEFLAIIRPHGPRLPNQIPESLSRCHAAGGLWWDAKRQDDWAMRRAAAFSLLLADGAEPNSSWTKHFESVHSETHIGDLSRSLARDHTLGMSRALTTDQIKGLIDESMARLPVKQDFAIEDVRADLERMKERVARERGTSSALGLGGSVGQRPIPNQAQEPEMLPGEHLQGCRQGRSCPKHVGWSRIQSALKKVRDDCPGIDRLKTLAGHDRTASRPYPFAKPRKEVFVRHCAMLLWFEGHFGK